VPLLFAATLFVSASLLFMVQPMVGKMVLPLLGGSPAVWNACMVFFQALLLLGYLYAHHVSGKYPPRQQWLLHLLVLGLPLAAFVLAVMFGSRHSPIAIAESLAPDGDSSPVLSVLLLLTVAIGVPFFVVSTSAPLLQKWFTCTGHPSARDPYFLYSASNFGSMISLLGYPLFIEPYLTITEQAWVFAIGFALLAAMVAFCGHAAANPIGVPPGTSQLPANKQLQKSGQQNGQQLDANRPVAPLGGEPPPTLARKAKWITLAFVPSSLMLGVTFYMTTDIASIPLLWVAPLALYLVTFIIAFGRVPEWFRIVIGNLAPVMILLLVFVLLSGVNPGIGITLLLHLLTFFAAALMCHYELARDRPSAQYLTEFFLLMSVGGVLGGIFNSLLAPLIFPHAYEYRIVLVLACLMVPRLLETEDTATEKKKEKARKDADTKKGSPITEKSTGGPNAHTSTVEPRPWRPLALDIAIPVLLGVGFYFYQQLPGVGWFARKERGFAESIGISPQTIQIILIYAVPVMLCFFFVDRPLRFALSVAAILGYNTYREEGREAIYSERSFFGILKIEKVIDEQRPNYRLDCQLTDQAIAALQTANVPETVLAKLYPLKDNKFTKESFVKEMSKHLGWFKLTEEEFTALRYAGVPEAVLKKLIPLKDKQLSWEDLQKEIAKLLTPEETKQFQDIILYRVKFLGWLTLTDEEFVALQKVKVPEGVLFKLFSLKDKRLYREDLQKEIAKLLTPEETKQFQDIILNGAKLFISDEMEQWKDLILSHVKMEHPEDVYSGEIIYHRLVHGTTLHGTQIYKMQNNVFDMFQALTALNPLENLVVAVANHEFDSRQEPLTYYHRSGPVGAMFHELRTRKGGADAKAPFAMVGLGTGSASCYALRGQELTFYEIDPAVKHLTYDIDKYFSYVTDAQNRGAKLDIHMGDARLVLKKDTDRKYALLLVDAFSSDSIPVHLLTKEAVQLYFDRMTDDGILALHISNKYVRLEPVVGAIASDLGITARVWNDDAERKGPGKTASSWVVLARTPADLGNLFTPIGDLPFALKPDSNGDEKLRYLAIQRSNGDWTGQSFMDTSLNSCLATDYSEELEKKTNGKEKRTELDEAKSPRDAWLGWIKDKLQRVTDPSERERLQLYEKLIGENGARFKLTDQVFVALKSENVPESVLVKLNPLTYKEFTRDNIVEEINKLLNADETNRFQSLILNRAEYDPRVDLHDLMMQNYGHAFRKLEVYKEVHAWTDDYSDVMRVMMIPELQRIRKFFGLPTPIER